MALRTSRASSTIGILLMALGTLAAFPAPVVPAGFAVTGVFPDHGPSTAPVDVRISGTGFHPGLRTEVNFLRSPFLLGSYDVASAGSRDAFYQDGLVYLPGGHGLLIFDVTDPVKPIPLGRCPTSGAGGVVVVGSTAYLATVDLGLLIVDVSNPSAPAVIGSYAMMAGAVAVAAGRAYVADPVGIHILDVSVPSAPRRIGSIAQQASRLIVKGETAYVIAGSALLIYDVSDPSRPVLLSTWDGAMPQDVFVRDSTAYVTTWNQGFFVLDVSQPASPRLLGSCAADPGTERVAVSGNVAVITGLGSVVQVLDVSDPAAPRPAGSFRGEGERSLMSAFLAGSTGYFADFQGGFHIVDFSQPSTPVLVGRFATLNWPVDIAVNGPVAYVVDPYVGLQIIEVSNAADPRLLSSSYLPSRATGVAVSGSTAYVADPFSGLFIYDVSNPVAPALLATFATEAMDVEVHGTLACVAEAAGLLVLDVSNPASPQVVGRYGMPTGYRRVRLRDSLAFVADGSGLTILDLANPASPALLGTLAGSEYCCGFSAVAVSGSTVFAVGTEKLAIIDASDPTSPTLLREYGALFPGEKDVRADGSRLYVSDGAQLRVMDVSNPASPVLLGSYVPSGEPLAITLAGSTAYLAGTAGLQVLDVTTPPLTPANILIESEGAISATLPAGMTAGSWHAQVAVMEYPGGSSTLRNAYRAQDVPTPTRHLVFRVPVRIGRSYSRVFVWKNWSGRSVTLQSVELNSGYFTLVAPPVSGTVIPAGGSLALRVRFRPRSVGFLKDWLTLRTDRPTGGLVSVRCLGRGF